LEGLKNQIIIFCTSADGFNKIWLPFVEKFKIKFLLASLKSLTNSENPSINPLQEACSGFQVTACDSKSCWKAACVYENGSESRYDMYCTLEKIYQ
jgi:hypothetical protein